MSPSPRAWVLAVVLAAAGTAQAAGPAITNGSFDGPIGLAVTPPGWTAGLGNPDTVDVSGNFGWVGTPFAAVASPSPDGNTWLGLGRDPAIAVVETAFQTVTGLVAGTPYAVSWYHANFGYQENGFDFTAPNAVELLVDGVSAGAGSMRALSPGWGLDTVTFVAGASSATLTFRLLDDVPSYHGLDGVTISAVPEPATWALLAAGLGVVGAAARRTRRPTGTAAG